MSARNQRSFARIAAVAVAMFGFGYLLVPIYDVFCEITGLGGRTGYQATVVQMEPDLDRTVTVEFVASVNQGAPWDFRPSVSRMEIHPGEMYQTSFFARNESEEFLVGHAVPSVAPGQAARYLQKTECFCFNNQVLEPGETLELPAVHLGFFEGTLDDGVGDVAASRWRRVSPLPSSRSAWWRSRSLPVRAWPTRGSTRVSGTTRRPAHAPTSWAPTASLTKGTSTSGRRAFARTSSDTSRRTTTSSTI